MSDAEVGDPTPHDNDADARPRVYMRSATRDGEVEVTVQGCEGEGAGDVASLAAERFDHAVQAQDELAEDDGDRRGLQ